METIRVDYDLRCPDEIPGLGQCEVKGEHKMDGVGRKIHKVGACSWNGGKVLEFDMTTPEGRLLWKNYKKP